MMTKKSLLLVFVTAIVSVAATIIIRDELGPSTPVAEPTESPKENGICMDYKSEDMSTLNVDLVHTMVDEYKSNQWNFINTNPRFNAKISNDDARAIWFDLETLKQFIYHIEKETKAQDSTITSNNLGVRLYYATYPDQDIMNKFGDLKSTSVRRSDLLNYHNRHTLVMIPTIQKEDGDILDFNPLDKDTYDGTLLTNKKYKFNANDTINSRTSTTILGLTGTPDVRRTGSKNHGMLTPPDAVSTLAF